MRVLALVVAALVLAGCGETSFLGRQFDNFTAKYNAYYNANRQFKEQVKSIERRQEDEVIDRDRYLLVFTPPDNRSGGQAFDEVVTKSADILRKHPRSKWVDDALMLIGKSYFYQGNFVGAEQKFGEVVDLGGDLADEARFWLARTLVAGESYQPALDLLQQSLEREDLDRRWRAQMQLLLGDLYLEQRDWEAAALALEPGIDRAGNNDLAARAQFLLGQVYETQGRYEEAADAYRRVPRFKPLYELIYAARFNEARVRGLHLDVGRGLQLTRRMMRDDKNFDNLDELDLLHGQLLQRDGSIGEAIVLFEDMLYPTDGSSATQYRGQVHYALGELYRDDAINFFLAAAHFDTAATAIRTSRTTEELYTPSAITGVREQADVFAQFGEVAREVIKMDSLLYLGTLGDAEFEVEVERVRLQLAEEARERQADLERRRAESGFRSGGVGERGGTRAAPASRPGQYGFLNHRNPQQVQEGFLQFQEIWGERPLVPGWRRQEIVAVAIQEAEAASEDGEAEELTGLGLFLPPVDVSEVPRDPDSRSDMLSKRAAARYEMANLLFLSMSMPDSAASWYRRVVVEDAGEPVAERALYALAEVNLSLGDSTAADRLYREILDQSLTGDFANRARERLGLPPVDAAPDSLQLARLAYASAYESWQDGAYEPALERMLVTAVEYRNTDVAPQALLATGLIFTEWAAADSLDLFAPMPVADSLFADSLHSVALQRALEAQPADTVLQAQASDEPSSDERSVEERRRQLMELDEQGELQALRPNPEATGGDERPRGVLPADDTIPADDAAPARDVLPREVDTPAARIADETPTPAPNLDELPASIRAAMAEVSDSLASAGATDILDAPGMASDSTLASAPDLTEATPDSAQADLVQIENAPADSAEAEMPVYFIAGLIPQPLVLETLYESVESNYAQTPFADRARNLREALDLRRPAPPVPDSVAADSAGATFAALDSLAADSLGGSVLPPVASDSVAVASSAPDSTPTDSMRTESAAPAPVVREQPANVTAAGDSVYARVDIPPQLLGGVPSIIRRVPYAGDATGTVIVAFTVTAKGRVEDAEVIQAVDPELDAAVLQVLGRLRFRPGIDKGRPVAARHRLELPFGDTEGQ
ncbi:MAG: TonB family protein [Bacteroidota bacterium]